MPKRLTLAKIFLESFLWQIFCSSIFLSTYFFAKRIVSQILAKKCFWAPSWQDSGAGGRSRIVHFMNFSYGPLNLQTCKVSKLPDFFPGKNPQWLYYNHKNVNRYLTQKLPIFRACANGDLLSIIKNNFWKFEKNSPRSILRTKRAGSFIFCN